MVNAGVNFGVDPSRSGIDLAEELLELTRERNAVILAHNYQVPELQDVADYVGDTLGLSYEARKTDADVILFCGVHFMAATATIINHTKHEILPDRDCAGPPRIHLRGAHARRRSLFDGKNGNVLQRVGPTRDHRGHGSGIVA